MNQHSRIALKLVATIAVAVGSGSVVQAAGWGNIKGKFVIDGTAPKVPAIDASKDAFCVSAHPVDESVEVSKDSATLSCSCAWGRERRLTSTQILPRRKASR
jgi:hypothetical protein